MIYIYRPTTSNSARDLAEAIDGVRIRHDHNLIRRVRPADKVIMWGAYLPEMANRATALNNVPFANKYEDAMRLREAGVSTVEVSRQRPAPIVQPAPVDPLIAVWDDAQDAAEAFVGLQLTRNMVAQEGITELSGKLTRMLAAMRQAAPTALQAVPTGEWVGRNFTHVGGNDLLTPTQHPDYFSKKEVFVEEYRVHSFMGRSIRAGRKVPREGFSVDGPQRYHPWVKSFDGGWMITYEGEQVRQKHRDIAHTAITTLGLQFGAVDIGERADGTLVVLEVNRAPGLEGGTIDAYARSIRRWIDEGRQQPVDGRRAA